MRFDVRGKDFTTTLEAIDRYPDSYLAWLVRNAPEQVRSGRPISINRKPESFRSLLETYRRANSHSDTSLRRAVSRRQMLMARNERSLTPVYDDPPTSTSSARMQQPPPPPRPPPPPGPPQPLSSSFHSQPNTYHDPPFQSSNGRPQRTGSGGGLGPHWVTAQKGTDEVVVESVRDIVLMLQKYVHKRHRHM